MSIQWDRAKATRLVRTMYKEVFGREPEPEILKGLTAYFAAGRISVRIQLARMLKSDEFFDKRLRGKTPGEMALELYKYILAHAPATPEAHKAAADFVGNLGWRVQVDVMINSEEYLDKFGDDLLPFAK
jgi:hypothetical protein